jgi:catechol 2,3-dioxygenase-like lactoylglutathione lyase family enzyme
MNFELDHVAVESNNIPASISWYTEKCGAAVLYQDATWALLQIGKGKLALVTPSQHSQHIGLRVDTKDLERASQEYGKKIDSHRDGTRGIYIEDPDGNTIELITYPD